MLGRFSDEEDYDEDDVDDDDHDHDDHDAGRRIDIASKIFCQRGSCLSS